MPYPAFSHAHRSVAACRQLILEQATAMPTKTETVPLHQARGRILSADLYAPEGFPPFSTARMDGYAVSLSDFSDGKSAQLHVIGHIGAGDSCDCVHRPHTAVRIMTGARIPEGFDAVVKLEDAQVVLGDGSVQSDIVCAAPHYKHQHITTRDSYFASGELLAHQGTAITPVGIGLAATAGITSVQVYQTPRVAIASIGNELVDISSTPLAGQIRNSNTPMLAALIEEAGAHVEVHQPLPDALDDITAWLIACADSNKIDMIITTGGTARGDYDFIAQALRQAGTVCYDQVDMVPAPTHVFGTIADHTLVFGLPGVPGAALTAFEMMVRPALAALMHRPHALRPQVQAALISDVPLRGNKEHPRYLRGQLYRLDDGHLGVCLDETDAYCEHKPSWIRGGSYDCIALIEQSMQAGEVVNCIVTAVTEDVDWIR